jgi:hypothetical protein
VALITPTSVISSPAASQAAASAPPEQKHHGFSFSDFLDIINPLQHIPVVSTIYRAITHDTIDTPEKIVGDTLYGGALGFLSSIADTAFEAITGKDFGDTALALITGSDKTPAIQPEKPQTELAVTATAPTLIPSGEAPIATSEAAPERAALSGEEALTAALNRAQIEPALAQRAAFAYGRAFGLSQTKLPDEAALAF